jgi:hypothetical protein
VIAYKFLRDDGTGVFTRFAWPLPDGGGPGEWVQAPILTCHSGIHACRVSDLPLWLGRELYEIELADPIVEERTKVVASRGRLVRRIGAWNDDTRAAYARDCADRAHAYAAGMPDWEMAVEPAAAGGPASIGFIAARIAEARDGLEAYRAERARQVAWLAQRLDL